MPQGVVLSLCLIFGVNCTKQFGYTADYAREECEDASDLQFVVGIRVWN
ncbi:MAG: copper resistance protein B [Candidatus Thiodiazotropha sp. (ex Ustalcina ferruginea)]|nr:copper resistance protein B [Candidatus Thiodiazotropha sp. (ex Ustalcina ferruginea)]